MIHLRIITGVEAPISAKEIKRISETRTFKVSPGNITKYLQRLVEKRLVNKSGRGLYSVPDRMFRAYVRFRSDWR